MDPVERHRSNCPPPARCQRGLVAKNSQVNPAASLDSPSPALPHSITATVRARKATPRTGNSPPARRNASLNSRRPTCRVANRGGGGDGWRGSGTITLHISHFPTYQAFSPALDPVLIITHAPLHVCVSRERRVERGRNQKGKRQRTKRKAMEPMAESCTLRVFLKNEATDLLDNKGSALDEIRNEATVDVGPAFKPASFAIFWRGFVRSAIPTNGSTLSPERKLREPMAESCKRRAFLKNEATDLLDNKGSALGEIRNEATVFGSEAGWQKARRRAVARKIRRLTLK